MKYLALLTAFAWATQIHAQTITLTTSNAKVTVHNNGVLFNNGTAGGYVAPYIPGQPEVSAMRSAGLWVGGIDPSGNLHLAAQMSSAADSDFSEGSLPDEGSPAVPITGIFHVERPQVLAHLQDFANNGQVDAPSPEIFGWPATGNASFSGTNGLPFNSVHGLAGFRDRNENGFFEPEDGEYPSIDMRTCALNIVPDQLSCFWWNDKQGPLHTLSGAEPLSLNIMTQIFNFECVEGAPINNTIFAGHKIFNGTDVPLQDVYVGIYLDFAIGAPGDDYFGFDAEHQTVYAYNADNEDALYGNNPVMMSAQILRTPFVLLNGNVSEAPVAHVMPAENVVAGNPQSFYNLLRGYFADGQPAPNQGVFFTGNPLEPGSNSEPGLGNTPGHRKVLVSLGPISLLPGAINEVFVAYTFTQEGSLAANYTALQHSASEIRAFFDNCFYDDLTGCSGVLAASENAIDPNAFSLSPNPAAESVRIKGEIPLARVRLMDVNGRTVRQIECTGETEVDMSLVNLPAGLYNAVIQSTDGRMANKKLAHF